MDINLIIEITGAIIGLTYLYFEYKASFWMWRVGFVMNLFYIYIFYNAQFYADSAIYVYYLATTIYGSISWGVEKKQREKPVLSISHLRKKEYFYLLLYLLIAHGILYFILVKFTNSPVPFGDSFTTALSFVGMWMIAKKRIEHWWVWFVVNVVSTGLYIWKGLYPTSILFTVYSVVSVLGYFKWKRLMKEDLLEKI